MKTWYKAVCDKHKEACDVMVSNPSCTHAYLKKHDQEIQKFLETHYGCNLRLIHRDEDMDQLWDNNYFVVELS